MRLASGAFYKPVQILAFYDLVKDGFLEKDRLLLSEKKGPAMRALLIGILFKTKVFV